VHPESQLEINAFCIFQVAILGAHTLNHTKAIRGWRRGSKQSTGLLPNWACRDSYCLKVLASRSFLISSFRWVALNIWLRLPILQDFAYIFGYMITKISYGLVGKPVYLMKSGDIYPQILPDDRY